MPRYFMHLRDRTDVAFDEEGIDYPDEEAMQRAALLCARDCIAGDAIANGAIDLGLRIDVEDEAGELVYSLPFADAVNVIPA